MTDASPNVTTVTMQIPRSLPAAIVRPHQHIEAVLAQSLREMGDQGRTALAWAWALTGSRPSPVTLSLPTGHPPTRPEILAEADAEPEGSTAPAGVPSDYCDQLGEARRVLLWLTGESDEIPVDDANHGRLIGARDDYARTDAEIRHVRDRAQRGLDAFDSPDFVDPGGSADPWRRSPEWMNAAWLCAVRDLLDWVLGDRSTAPLSGRAVDTPTAYDLTHEENIADDIIQQGRPGGLPTDPATYPPPQYGEAIHATAHWLRAETTAVPVDEHSNSPYVPPGRTSAIAAGERHRPT
jgi:hypothetical protein